MVTQQDFLYFNGEENRESSVWLIQRMTREKHRAFDPNLPISSRFRLDYMGAAEFEFGAIPDSRKRIKKNLSSYEIVDHPDVLDENRTLWTFGPAGRAADIKRIVQAILAGTCRLKERTNLEPWVRDPARDRESVHDRYHLWWDLNNDYFFAFHAKDVIDIKKAFEELK